MTPRILLLLLPGLLWPLTAQADRDLPSFLRRNNAQVDSGNERMAAGDAKGALAAYDEAAKALPNEAGVQLNRGLALMEQAQMGEAREALLRATQPPASRELRASAYYNLGNAFFKEADQQAGEEQHEAAKKLFREAIDAYKQSLRLHPGDHATAWNLQLATRRLQEQAQKQQEKDQQQKDQQQKDQQQKDQQQKDQQQKDQQQKDQQQKDQQQQDQQQQDQQQQDQQQQDQQQQDQQQKDQQQKDQQQKDQQQKDQQQALPAEAERALDALQDSEENLQHYQAKQRAMEQRRRPAKDW